MELQLQIVFGLIAACLEFVVSSLKQHLSALLSLELLTQSQSPPLVEKPHIHFNLEPEFYQMDLLSAQLE
jgi:hypothetical protein